MKSVVASLKTAVRDERERGGHPFKNKLSGHAGRIPVEAGEDRTLSLQARSKHFDFGGVDSRLHHHFGGEAWDRLAPVLEQQGVHAGREGEVGHRVGPVFVVQHLRFSLHTCTKSSSPTVVSLLEDSDAISTALAVQQHVQMLREALCFARLFLDGRSWDSPGLPGRELAGLAGGESSAASRLSSPGPAREQSTLTTLVSPT